MCAAPIEKATRVQIVEESWYPSSAVRIGGELPSISVVACGSPNAQALEAQLCDAGVAFTRLPSLNVEQLAAIDTPVTVVFVDDFLSAGWLAALSTLHSRRPDLALVCVAGPLERSLLWREFEGAALPPLVLRDSAPASLVYDALRIAHDAYVAERLGVAGSRSELPSMLGAQGQLCDHTFDRLLPIRLRAASQEFWTPIAVARRAATWLEELGVRSVVDIGSGVGKFCIAAALSTSCQFVGIEQRPQLAAVARNLARLYAVDQRVSIIEGRFGDVETPPADCYYLYNPFQENLYPAAEAVNDEVELSRARFRQDLRGLRALVADLPVGTYVLTYNGVGGRLPDCLDEVRVDHTAPAVLRLLQKVERSGQRGAVRRAYGTILKAIA